MKFIQTLIPGAYLIHPKFFKDKRGVFIKTFHIDTFKEQNIECDFKESFYSYSKKNVIRGMHFQNPPHDHAKLVYVSQGAVLDVLVDLRKGSPAYGKFFSAELSSENHQLIYIPQGCAHGYLSTKDNSCVIYMHTTVHVPGADTGIHFESFGFNWGVENPILSDRDKSFKHLSDYESPFIYLEKG